MLSAFNLYGNTRRSRKRTDPSGLVCEPSAGWMRESERLCDSHHIHVMSQSIDRGNLLVLLPYNSYLVDPASSHMLVSKIKPCMSKYKHLYTVKLRTAHYISNYLFDGSLLHG